MWTLSLFASLLAPLVLLSLSVDAKPFEHREDVRSLTSRRQSPSVIKPKVMIIDLFDLEEEAWQNIPEFNVLAQNITVPGFSPLFPDAHCTANGDICQVVTGEAEINAASTTTALAHSPLFDLTNTYFLIAGIAGVNPKVATIGDVTFARYEVQVALQFEIDAREIPSNFSTGYVPQGTTAPGEFPSTLYGTEVFEVNDALRQIAINFARNVTLNDTADAQAARALYNTTPAFSIGSTGPPNVVACDSATSDVFWSGDLLGEAFENTTKLFTNGSGVYCTTQQEDNGVLEALMRAALTNLVDFSRIIIMRTASDFDRPFAGQTATENLFGPTPGFDPSIANIHLAGVQVVLGIVDGWNATFESGVTPTNYVGDIFGSLGGEPDFGPGNMFGNMTAPQKRDLMKKRMASRRRSRRSRWM